MNIGMRVPSLLLYQTCLTSTMRDRRGLGALPQFALAGAAEVDAVDARRGVEAAEGEEGLGAVFLGRDAGRTDAGEFKRAAGFAF
jgi:hypothetical protein